MKKSCLALLAIAAALAITPAAMADPLTLTFTGNGGGGYITIINSTTASGSGIAITSLTVAGDPGYDGTYAVTGLLSFNTSLGSESVTIVGGVSSLDVANGTTLLQGTGGSSFSNVVVTGNSSPCGYGQECPTVSFDDTDTKNAGLLLALGIPGTQWGLCHIRCCAGHRQRIPRTLSGSYEHGGSRTILSAVTRHWPARPGVCSLSEGQEGVRPDPERLVSLFPLFHLV